MTNWLIEFENIHYTYPGTTGKPALNGLTLRIPPHKKCVLLGHNGSGKSTLFLHANGIHKPDHGRVLFHGEPLKYNRRALAEVRRRVGLVFQDPEQQLVASTVAEDLSYGLCNLKYPVDVIKEKINHIMDRFSLGEFADRPVHHLSLGQKKRLALAGVMVLEPELLLLDEPTAYLDKKNTQQLLQELNQIHESGTTILMATHDLDVAWEWGEWIIVMDQGTLVFEGTPEEVFRQKELMKELNLGVPLLFEVWEMLVNQMNISYSGEKRIPRNVKELRTLLNSSIL